MELVFQPTETLFSFAKKLTVENPLKLGSNNLIH